MVLSNTLQSTRLFYDYNKITQTLAAIFLHKDPNDREFPASEYAAKQASSLLQEEFDVQAVDVHTNLSKSEIIYKLDQLQT